jgi:hypothetical protein
MLGFNISNGDAPKRGTYAMLTAYETCLVKLSLLLPLAKALYILSLVHVNGLISHSQSTRLREGQILIAKTKLPQWRPRWTLSPSSKALEEIFEGENS